MSQNQQSQYNISNEQLLLINILNGMYNDNLSQLDNLNDTIYSLNESNRQIRNLLIQILNNNNNTNNNNNNTNNNSHNIRNTRYNNRNNSREYSSSYYNSSSGLGRIYLNNTPYIIDNLEYYNIPITRENANSNISQLLQNFLQPVEVFPTQSQIETATRRAIYGDIVTPRNRSCPISLETFNDTDTVTVIRFCGHIFNTEQLNTWFRSNCRCPVCRYDIRRYNSNTGSEFFNNNETSSTSSTHINSTQSTPINNTENVVSNLSQERTNTTNDLNNQNTRSSASSIFNGIIDTFINDYNLNEFNNLINNMDISGNTTDNLTIFRLLSELNNRTR